MTPRSIAPRALVFAWALACSFPVNGQNEIHVVPGHGPGDHFGLDVCGLLDVDGDGVADFAASGRAGVMGGAHVSVHSGATGMLLLEIRAPSGSVKFGARLCGAGDLDSDGVGDLLIADPEAGPDSVGRVDVYSGATGAVLLSIPSPYPGLPGAPALWGTSMDNMGDLDGDGLPDYVIGAPGSDPGGTGGAPETGHAAVISGATGMPLPGWLMEGSSAYCRLGFAVANAGDVDADGVDDVLVGTPGFGGSQNRGRVAVRSGADGSLIAGIIGYVNTWYGDSLDGVGDVNGDGYGDLTIGAPGMGDHGGAEVVSGRTLATLQGDLILHQFFPREGAVGFPGRIRGVGDLNLDGAPDIAVSDSALGVSLFSGADGTLLYEVPHPGGPITLPIPIAALGDISLDGCADYILGIEGDVGDVGQVLVLNGSGVVRNYGISAPNQDFADGSEIGFTGSVAVLDNNFTLIAQDATTNQFGIFFYGSERAQVPLFNGYLHVGGTLRRLYPPVQTDALGWSSTTLDFSTLPPGGAIAGGDMWNFQFWYRDAGSSNFSNALSVLFAP